MRAETMQRLAAEVIALLETNGVRKTFDRFVRIGGRPMRANHQFYQGGNVIALWAAAVTHGYTSRHWMTFKQAAELGASVRKGERSTIVCYVDKWVPEAERAKEDPKKIAFLKAFPVFNADQIDGLPDAYRAQLPEREFNPVPAVEAFVGKTQAVIKEVGGTPPCYVPALDRVHMPPRATYHTEGGFYGDLLHELVHWTGAKHRLAREQAKRWGDQAYAYEELVAEIGSAFLCTDFGVGKEVERDQAPYLAHWLHRLKDDPTLLWSASRAAETAADYLHNCGQQALAA